MTDENRRRSERSDAPAPDLRSERDQFLQKFTRGARITDEFLREYEQLAQRMEAVETENALLRNQVEAGDAIRELSRKIEHLEREKAELLSRFRRVEAQSTTVSARVEEVELEFANLANLFVASNQIHSSLSPRGVTRRIKEVLAQIVGAERYSMYFVNPSGTELVPIASEGVAGNDLVPVRVAGTMVGEVFRSGAAIVNEDVQPSQGTLDTPAAIIPLSVDDRVVGVIAIFSTLSQKERFDTVDFELFKLLGQHAAAALVSASLFVQADRKLPGLEAFLDLSV
ncbi:MAG TPA: GAF domain-containing protein [Polyangiaceae bacterium]|nr:GAF domain-containing protein [Polyangiaceae bacterium]